MDTVHSGQHVPRARPLVHLRRRQLPAGRPHWPHLPAAVHGAQPLAGEARPGAHALPLLHLPLPLLRIFELLITS